MPRLAKWIERWRIKGWEGQLNEYLPLGLDELSVELADDFVALQEGLEGHRKLHGVAFAAAEARHLDWSRLRRLERAVAPVVALSNTLAAKYDLVQRRRYEHACKAARREIPWDEWNRDNPTSAQLRRGQPSKRTSISDP